MMGGACVIDTLHIDTDKMQIALVWRAAILEEMRPIKAQLRYQTDPLQPLMSWDPQTRLSLEALRAGEDDTLPGTLLPMSPSGSDLYPEPAPRPPQHSVQQGATHG
jgi:hypothetical protein